MPLSSHLSTRLLLSFSLFLSLLLSSTGKILCAAQVEADKPEKGLNALLNCCLMKEAVFFSLLLLFLGRHKAKHSKTDHLFTWGV
jgi:hypothetical protein